MLNGRNTKSRLTKDPGITTRQLIRFFNPKLWHGYDSSSKVHLQLSSFPLHTSADIIRRASTPSLVHSTLVFLRKSLQQHLMTWVKIADRVQIIQLSGMKTHLSRARLEISTPFLVHSPHANLSLGVIYGICAMLRIDE